MSERHGNAEEERIPSSEIEEEKKKRGKKNERKKRARERERERERGREKEKRERERKKRERERVSINVTNCLFFIPQPHSMHLSQTNTNSPLLIEPLDWSFGADLAS